MHRIMYSSKSTVHNLHVHLIWGQCPSAQLPAAAECALETSVATATAETHTLCPSTSTVVSTSTMHAASKQSLDLHVILRK